MLKSFGDIFRIKDLRKRVLFTLGILAAYRLGAAIPVPGINAVALRQFFASQQGTLFGFMDLFSGGALNRMSIFALGVMPYINASIIVSLLRTVIPSLEKLSREGEIGRRKITRYTRFLTVFIAVIQALGLTFWLQSMRSPAGISVVPNPGFGFQFLTIVTLTAGTIFIMWLGEQITENGVGNGISLIIFTGIIARLPVETRNLFLLIKSGEIGIIGALFLVILMVVILGFVVWVEQAQRVIPIQYTQRIVGRKIYGGQSTYLPLKVDQSGVIAVIFAMAVMTFPATIGQFFPNSTFFQQAGNIFSPGGWLYSLIYGILIIFFCYFYTGISFNPDELAENLKRSGGFIPGVRPGKPTSDYIDYILTRITLGGAIFVVFVAILPQYFEKFFHSPFYFGGTALLIIVGVALDTIGQLESHLIMRHYEGFLKKGKVKGRYFNIR